MKHPDIINYDNLRFLVLPSKNPSQKEVQDYNNAYEAWLRVWKDAYKELKLEKPIYSDEFTRHDHINCIFYGAQCIASVHSRIVDISIPATVEDSYFKIWNTQDVKRIRSHGNKVMIISNMTVHKEWRKSFCDLSIKDLIIYLCCMRFKSSAAAVMATYTRNSKNVNELVKRFGAQVIRKDVQNFNKKDLVDLFIFSKDSVTAGTDPTVQTLGGKLLEKMNGIDHSSESEYPSTNKKVA